MRQLTRLRDVRAPDNRNADTLSQAQVRWMADNAEDMEGYNSAVISQIRLAQGSQGWTQPPAPAPSGAPTNANGYPSASGRQILGEVLSARPLDGDWILDLSHYAVPQTVQLYYNSMRLGVGEDLDYVVEESVTGAGYDRVRLTGALPPGVRDRIQVDYTQA